MTTEFDAMPEPARSVSPLTVIDCFAGIGGMSLGLERAGFRTVGQVEIDPYCQRVLTKHWPDVPRHSDIRTAVSWWHGRASVDLIAGGYPCQGESLAGQRLGHDDPRWLWPAMARLIESVRPRAVLTENVLGHRTKGLRYVLRDLERLGYTTYPGIISAVSVGAPHTRRRIFVVGIATGERRGQGGAGGPVGTDTDGTRITRARLDDISLASGARCRARWVNKSVDKLDEAGESDTYRFSWWPDEPDVCRVAYGVPNRVDRIRALGNAIVPRCAEYMGEVVRGILGE